MWWLSKAQPYLARIHTADGSSSGSDGSRRRTGSDQGSTSSVQEEALAQQAAQEAEVRLHTADYVEARGLLIPSSEYLQRAVAEASAQNILTGNLLITVTP